MWSIEISEEASEEEIESALLSEIDFDDVRRCVGELRDVVGKYGPFKEIDEKSEQTSVGEPIKKLKKNGDWTCEGLSDLNPLKIWTQFHDPVNDYSFIQPGYFEEGGRFNIVSWFISTNAVQDPDEQLCPTTEYFINVYNVDGDFDFYYRMDMWDLMSLDELSEKKIIGALWS
jgi:hypothetical protein